MRVIIATLITIALAVCILVLGLQSLISDAQEGVKWWSAEFWSRPLPDDPRAAAIGGPGGGGAAKESTPLSSKPQGQQEPSYNTAGAP